MKTIDLFATGIFGLFLGALVVAASESDFGSGTGVIIFCYGIFAILAAGWNKMMGRSEI